MQQADSDDISTILQQKLLAHYRARQPVAISGGNSKAFYGHTLQGAAINLASHHGIINYTPSELILTARAGTPLRQIEARLAEHGQMLPFEAPHFSDTATLGGCVASGLSGPRRPYSGAVRDYVLGMTILNGKAEKLKFGGEVMKNVAGYDVPRLMTGAFGTLGIILDVSLKVLPLPEREVTVKISCSAAQAHQQMLQLAAQPLPISGMCYDQDLMIRLSGSHAAVRAASEQLDAQVLADNQFWFDLKEQRLAFFQNDQLSLWRLSVPATCPLDIISGEQIIDWGGSQRWLYSTARAEEIWQLCAAHGGHASLFRHHAQHDEYFQPLPAVLKEIHLNLKLAFDPYAILNQGRMYRDF